jgi:hypothetical protein
MRAESDQGRLWPEALARQLTDVEFAAHGAHLGFRGVANMRVVRPHHGLGRVFCTQ